MTIHSLMDRVQRAIVDEDVDYWDRVMRPMPPPVSLEANQTADGRCSVYAVHWSSEHAVGPVDGPDLRMRLDDLKARLSDLGCTHVGLSERLACFVAMFAVREGA